MFRIKARRRSTIVCAAFAHLIVSSPALSEAPQNPINFQCSGVMENDRYEELLSRVSILGTSQFEESSSVEVVHIETHFSSNEINQRYLVNGTLFAVEIFDRGTRARQTIYIDNVGDETLYFNCEPAEETTDCSRFEHLHYSRSEGRPSPSDYISITFCSRADAELNDLNAFADVELRSGEVYRVDTGRLDPSDASSMRRRNLMWEWKGNVTDAQDFYTRHMQSLFSSPTRIK